MMHSHKKAPGLRSAAFSQGEIRLLGAAVVLAAITSLVLSVVGSAAAPVSLGGGGAAAVPGQEATAATD